MGRLTRNLAVLLLAALLLPPLAAQLIEWGPKPSWLPPRGEPIALATGRVVDVFDRGHGKPVVLVHGWASCAADWSDMPSRLVALGHRVIVYDRAGYGYSSRIDGDEEDFGFEAHARDLVALLDALGVDSAAVVGWSFGGGVAQTVALLAPERVTHLALVASTAPRAATEPASTLDRVLGTPLAGPLFHWLAALPPVHHKLAADALLLSFARPRDIPAGWLERTLAMLDLPDTAETLVMEARAARPEELRPEEITLPTLVVHGSSDFVIPYHIGEDLHRRLPNSQLEPIFDGSHMLPVTHAELLAEKIHELVGSTYREGVLDGSVPAPDSVPDVLIDSDGPPAQSLREVLGRL